MGADLNALLGQASNSLAVHRAATATASHNLQNVNTPGFARQRAELTTALPAEDTGHGQLGRGVSLLNVTQARDKFIENQMPMAMGDNAKSLAEAEILESVSALDPDSPNGLTAALGNFYASMRSMSQNPGDRGFRQGVVSTGQSLALAFNRADDALETSRTGVDAKLTASVSEINRAATAIADLNRSIRQALASGSSPNDLLDARQRHMDSLAALAGARAVDTGNGTVNMVLPGGTPLVVEFRAAAVGALPNAANGGHLDLTVTPSGAQSATVIAPTNLGGSVAGLLDARDVGLDNARTGLDQLAFEFATAFNTLHTAGFGLDGGTGRAFFVPIASATGAAGMLAVDAAVVADPRVIAASSTAAGTPGDNRALLDMIASESSPLAGGSDVGQTLSGVIADYGSLAAQARARFEQDSTALQHLEELRESTSGVSIDEELVSLTKSQRAFEAVMKVITTADEMLETLMSLR